MFNKTLVIGKLYKIEAFNSPGPFEIKLTKPVKVLDPSFLPDFQPPKKLRHPFYLIETEVLKVNGKTSRHSIIDVSQININ